jgi:hypothetical protein
MQRSFVHLFFLSGLGLLGSFWTLQCHLPVVSDDYYFVSCPRSTETPAWQNPLHLKRHMRTFSGDFVFRDYQYQDQLHQTPSEPLGACSKWVVVPLPTTGSVSVDVAIQMVPKIRPGNDWCTVLVATNDMSLSTIDKRGGDISVHVASLQQLRRQGGATEKFANALLRSASLSNNDESIYRNTGYLYAIQHGASHILDLDYGPDMEANWKSLDETMFGFDNDLLVDVPLIGGIRVLNSHSHVFNETTLGSSWPRGYPKAHEHTKKRSKIALSKTLDKSRIGIAHQISGLAPDLDAHGSLMMTTTDLRRTKTRDVTVARSNPLLAPLRTWVPYNAKSTLHTRATLWATLLPTSVPSRISDIWRSYMTQTILWDLDLYTLVVPPSHELVSEPPRMEEGSMVETHHFELDRVFYTHAPDLLRVLEQFTTETKDASLSIPQRMEALWVRMYEEGFLEAADIAAMQLWMQALLEHNQYQLPNQEIQKRPYFHNVVLMGQFNFATHIRTITAKELTAETVVALADTSYSVRVTRDKPDNHVRLVVEEDTTDMVAFWVQKWKEIFSNVVVRGPFTQHQLRSLNSVHQIEAYGMDGSRWNHTLHDNGFYSPIANLISTLEAYKSMPGIDGVMYIHDDMLLDVHDMIKTPVENSSSKFPSSKIIASAQATRGSFLDPRAIADNESIARRSYNIHVDGTFSKPNGQRFFDQKSLMESMEPWLWNQKYCIPRLAELARDPRAAPFRESNNGSILVPPWEPSDFLFVPTKFAEDFIEIASLFLEHRVFLECAVPTIVDMIRKRQVVAHDVVETRNLCTSWDDQVRGTDAMISECLDNDHDNDNENSLAGKTQQTYGMFHPYKLSHGMAPWDAMFDRVAYANTRISEAPA